ncbi:two component, sigma54 specific, transcriptional regulator, Fis family [Labilithrix luteola]|uniref:Two component, sigma54 specific, transcriptional regulator, Fis family n=1 Tax=Labilithrix luteola TaxID=1391654 RepID=A0A0K1PKK4_9BACT|nr:sigma 54-interacting transcriptional regulator [Labilithrix luteola]AKU94068.1 two component, sigma54 specific, transcriptional regulator, Fis family [Labilithrix luteola]
MSFKDESTNAYGAAPPLDLRSVDIVVVEGPDRGRRFVIEERIVRVGTAPGSHLRLADPTVSRVHCELRLNKGGVRILDTGSTNGTFVDGTRVRDAELVAGGTIRVGATVLLVELGEESVHIPISDSCRFGAVIGAGVEMRRVYAVLERAAPTEATVLIRGETGTGKELVAKAIHDKSSRANGPFVAVDCGAIAPTVIESELFGHVRGAFSGAVSDRKGLFEESDQGTLFLDEVGELPLSLQAKLLRVLETREVRRVGSNVNKRVDVRLLAATNRHLAQQVNEGAFRQDLYYRLAVIEVELPPLRARREDIPILAQHFYERFSGNTNPLSSELLGSLLARSWPGNIRELRNFVERLVSLGWSGAAPPKREEIPSSRVPHMPESMLMPIPVHLSLKDARGAVVEQFERFYLNALLAKTNGNVTRAAELAGVNRRFLQRMTARLGMRPTSDDQGDEEALDGPDELTEEPDSPPSSL